MNSPAKARMGGVSSLVYESGVTPQLTAVLYKGRFGGVSLDKRPGDVVSTGETEGRVAFIANGKGRCGR